MKISIFRRSSLFFPILLSIPAFLSFTYDVRSIFICFTLLQLLTFCTSGCFRNAASTEPGIRRVESRFTGSLLQYLIGVVLLFTFYLTIGKQWIDLPVCIGVSLITLEQLFEERLFAIGRRTDAILLSGINAILCCTGVLLRLFPWLCLLSLSISILVTLVNSPIRFRRPRFSFQYIPVSLLQEMLCPVLLCCGMIFYNMPVHFSVLSWSAWRLSRTFARCSSDESRKPRLLLALTVLVFAIVTILIHDSSPMLLFSSVSMLCTLVFLALDLKDILTAMFFLICGVCGALDFLTIGAAAAAISCLIAFDKRVFLKKV